MSDKSAEEYDYDGEMGQLVKRMALNPSLNLTQDVKGLLKDAYRAGLVRASDHFLACLERLPRRPFASDWMDAVTEVRIAAGKVCGE